jgi:NMD protein affecting ribosome stability and mRNA decay
MKTTCPQCGAEIEFRFDDSFVRVCGHCRAAVTRTDRGVETLGKIADLMPMQSPL